MPLHVSHPDGPVAAPIRPDEFALVEMVNLPTSDTGVGVGVGVGGIIHISIAQGSHGPRVTWYPGRPGPTEPSLTATTDDSPVLMNNGLAPCIARAASAEVAAWVGLDRQALIDFRCNGVSWTRQEVTSFVDGLQKV